MQAEGQVDVNEHKQKVFVARQEITGADRRWAAQYEAGDFVRYTKGSKRHGIEAGEYARALRVNRVLPAPDALQNVSTWDRPSSSAGIR